MNAASTNSTHSYPIRLSKPTANACSEADLRFTIVYELIRQRPEKLQAGPNSKIIGMQQVC
jgi:hypothetical protein